MSERRPGPRRNPSNRHQPSPARSDATVSADDGSPRAKGPSAEDQTTTPEPRKKRLRRPSTPELPRRVDETIDSAQSLFIAVPLPADVIALVDRTVNALSSEPWPVKWSDPHSARVALHFLGDLDPANAEVLRLALRGPISASESFDLRTADLGAFPSIRKPRVLWLGLWGPVHRLETLHGAIGTTLESLDITLEERPFSPNITLGRVRADHRDTKQRDLPQSIRTRFEALAASGAVTNKNPVPFPVTEVQLIRSHVHQKGARYEILETYPLHQPDEEI